MGSDWIECRLSDACRSVDYGLTESAVQEPVGPKFLRITDIVSGHIDWGTVPFVAVEERTFEKYKLHDGDIVLARTGASTGASCYIKNPPDAVFASYLVRLKARDGFESRFLAYYMRSELFWNYIRSVLGDKSAQPNASAATMTRAPLRIPRSLAQQRAIACILGTLDDKIDLNRRMSGTLEAAARALFKSWFVDFDPVRAKAEGRDPGIPPHLADLFPDRFQDSELGEIPAGWRAGSFGQVAESPRRGVQAEDIDPATPYIALEHMPRRCIALSDWSPADGVESNKSEFKRGEILFGKLRPYFHKVGIAPVDGVCSTDIVVVAPKEDAWFGFVLGHVSSVEFVDYTNAGSTGTKMPRTNWSEMARYPIAVPSEPLAQAFDRRTRAMAERIVAMVHESRTLAALRDTLLPKLVSGEMRIVDPERLVHEVVP